MRVFGIGYLIAFILDGALTMGSVWSDTIDAVSDWVTVLVAFATLAVLVLALIRKLTPWVPYALIAGLYILMISAVLLILVAGVALGADPDAIPHDATTRVLAERMPWLRPLMIGDGVLTMLAGTAALAFVLRTREAAPAVS